MGSEARTTPVTVLVPALGQQEINVVGNSYICLSANIEFQLKADEDQFSVMKKGRAFTSDDKFTKLTIKNPSSVTTLTTELQISNGRFEDNAFVISGGDPINQKKGDTLGNGSVVVGTTEGEILAEDTTRLSVIIYNNHATNILYVGTTGVTTANGLPVLPDASLALETGAQIKGIASAAGTDVRYIEEKV